MKPTSYDLYGSRTLRDPAVASTLLQAAIGLEFEQRDSSYQGLYYRAGDSAGENFLLKMNLDLIDNKPVESRFPEYHLLLYVNDTLRSDELKSVIQRVETTFAQLRHEVLPAADSPELA